MSNRPPLNAPSPAGHALGLLVDALADELAHEISTSPTVKAAVRDALDHLGDEYEPYRSAWWLA